jgi:hypothetical protein
MGFGLCTFSIVDLHFFCWSECIHKRHWTSTHHSSLITVMSICTYNPQSFHSNCVHLVLLFHLWSSNAYACTGLDGPCGIQQVQAHRFQHNWHMKVVRLTALCIGRLYLQGNVPGTHSC